METKYCKHCGQLINKEAVVCIKCGLQVEELKASERQQIVINNNNNNTSSGGYGRGRRFYGQKNKWVALALCITLGMVGAHKFYEGKTGYGILYLCTIGLFGFGWLGDIIALLCKPNPYYP